MPKNHFCLDRCELWWCPLLIVVCLIEDQLVFQQLTKQSISQRLQHQLGALLLQIQPTVIVVFFFSQNKRRLAQSLVRKVIFIKVVHQVLQRVAKVVRQVQAWQKGSVVRPMKYLSVMSKTRFSACTEARRRRMMNILISGAGSLSNHSTWLWTFKDTSLAAYEPLL